MCANCTPIRFEDTMFREYRNGALGIGGVTYLIEDINYNTHRYLKEKFFQELKRLGVD
jgi:hypothetical protein